MGKKHILYLKVCPMSKKCTRRTPGRKGQTRCGHWSTTQFMTSKVWISNKVMIAVCHTGCLKKKGDQRDLTWLPNQALCPFHNLFARLKMIPGYVRLLQETFFVPTVHSIAPTSPTIEATIIESYFANHPFFEAPCNRNRELPWAQAIFHRISLLSS